MRRDDRPLLVGLMPNKTNGGPPLTGAIGRRLCKWAGIPTRFGDAALLRHFQTTNLNLRYHRRLERDEANKQALDIYEHYRRIPIILCGREVAEIFGLAGWPFWTWNNSDVAVIPHPSGLNRAYNDPTACFRTGQILIRAMILAQKDRPTAFSNDVKSLTVE